MAGVKSVTDKIVEFLTSPFASGKDDDFFGEIDEGFESEYETEGNRALEPAYKPQRTERKVIQMQRGYEGSKGYDVAVYEPRAYNESIQIAQALKERKTVILNLQLLDREESQRIVDFLCGCTHALDGDQRKIGDSVFIFTPSNINLTQEMANSALSRDARWNQTQTL